MENESTAELAIMSNISSMTECTWLYRVHRLCDDKEPLLGRIESLSETPDDIVKPPSLTT